MKQRPKTLSKKFHIQTRETYEAYIDIPADVNRWPRNWIEIYFKTYPHAEKKILPPAVKMDRSLVEVITKRFSNDSFDQETISLEELSTILHYSIGLRTNPKSTAPELTRRFYTSGGSRYPIETYIVAQNVSGLERGIYHYNVKEHAMECLAKSNRSIQQFQKSLVDKTTVTAPLFFIFTLVWERVLPKYHDLGYRIALIETGHMAQNALLVASAFDLQTRPSIGIKNNMIEKCLALDPEYEASLYSVVFGKNQTSV